MSAAETLARFAADLRYQDLPLGVVGRAKDCILDSIGVAIFGSHLPWSQAILAHVSRYGTGGPATILTPGGRTTQTPFAALANGAFTHAFELDNLRQPGAGVHAGAAIAMPALAVAQEVGADGRDLIRAFVAATEVMFRIGAASLHTPERRGFHEPGLTGTFGSALASGLLMGLDQERLVNALGIAGSLSSGLLEFAKSGGGMVKRLHLGRAAEGGVLAASLARDGFTGPPSVLDGEFGFLNVFCTEAAPDLLTAGLGQEFETLNICIKRYPCHVTAHTPVQSLRELMAEHGFAGDDVETIKVGASSKVLSHHDIPEPGDIMGAQYSVPFCLAIALYLDPEDAANFTDGTVSNPTIRKAAAKVGLELDARADAPGRGWASTLTVRLTDGREFTRAADTFKGAPQWPQSPAELAGKFDRLTTPALGPERAPALRETLEGLEEVHDLRSILIEALV
ncbi:MAG: MmgE/PrpD family protein [Alphaproteobacteria bacterium]